MGGEAGTRLSAGWPRDTDCVTAVGLPLALALGQLWEGVYCCHNNSWQLPTEPAPCWAAGGGGRGGGQGRQWAEPAVGRVERWLWGDWRGPGVPSGCWGWELCLLGLGFAWGGGLLHLLVQTQGVWLVSALERGCPRDT